MASLVLGKMGVGDLTIFDEDGVTDHNLPNQFYRRSDVKRFKVDCLSSIISDFSAAKVIPMLEFYKDQALEETVIVATDSMSSRRDVWAQFLEQRQCKNLIEARMGAQLGYVYLIRSKSDEDRAFYEERLNVDKKVKPVPCTAKTIIYNVLMLSSLICRAYRAVIQNEEHPREVMFNMTTMTEMSWMIRQ